MTTRITPKAFAAIATLAFLAAGTGAYLTSNSASATHSPANKMAVSGSALEIITAPLLAGASTTTAELLKGTIKTSSPTDVIFSVNLECALWTDITTVGNDDSESVARVKVWVELDGKPVAVSGDDTAETGKVVFCDRAYRRTTTDFDDEDARIDSYLRTRSAHSFDWISMNLGSGTHTISVKGELQTAVTGTGMAQAAIGKRTLIAEPTKLANDIVI